jgi:hypothetical protein
MSWEEGGKNTHEIEVRAELGDVRHRAAVHCVRPHTWCSFLEYTLRGEVAEHPRWDAKHFSFETKIQIDQTETSARHTHNVLVHPDFLRQVGLGDAVRVCVLDDGRDVGVRHGLQA